MTLAMGGSREARLKTISEARSRSKRRATAEEQVGDREDSDKG
jgi:hypothetical protein